PDPNPKNIISRSSDPISAIFFLLDRARRPRHNKKKIAEIGLVDREIIAKNDFFTFDQSWLRHITDRSVQNTTCEELCEEPCRGTCGGTCEELCEEPCGDLWGNLWGLENLPLGLSFFRRIDS